MARPYSNSGCLQLITLCVFTFPLSLAAQNSDTSIIDSKLRSQLMIGNFCLCQTRMSDLSGSSDDFRQVDVEEMDLPKKCGGFDSRFHGGKGVASDKYSGLIFQEGNVDGYLGKIRLTNKFVGKLPNGVQIDLRTMKLRDVFVIYPALQESWNSRGCSDYWKFSNDTVSFYVKIDKSIQPQFPIKESDYLDKPIEGVDIVTSCSKLLRPSAPIHLSGPNEPMYFIDSIRTNLRFIENNFEPGEIASVVVIKDENARRIGGEGAKNGIIYIFTKHYARHYYWMLLRKKSVSYSESLKSPDDADVIYILNDKVLPANFESDMLSINENNLIDVVVIDRRQLKKRYSVTGRIGVVLRTKD